MQRPTWTKVVGGLMILFGGCGITQDIKQIKSEALTEFSLELAEEIEKEASAEDLGEQELKLIRQFSKVEGTEESSDSTLVVEDLASAIKSMSYMSPAATSKMVLHGNIGVVISILYAIAGIVFLATRKHAIKIATMMLIVSLLFASYQLFDTQDLAVSVIMKMGLDFNLYTGAVFDIVLLLILKVSDKSYFGQHESGKDYYDELV